MAEWPQVVTRSELRGRLTYPEDGIAEHEELVIPADLGREFARAAKKIREDAADSDAMGERWEFSDFDALFDVLARYEREIGD